MPLQATSGAASYDAFGGGAAAVPQYIEDVFSTWLYTGNSTTGGTQTITNNIDLSTKGGMVWIKGRSAASDHILTNTSRGAGTTASNNQALASNLTAAEDLGASYDFLSAFNTTGFTVKQGGTTATTRGTNYNNVTYASWTFRKQPKFFDVVTWSGNGTTQAISHNLGSVPGFIIVKKTNSAEDWWCFHRYDFTYRFKLNATNAAVNTTSVKYLGNNVVDVTPTSTSFTVGDTGGLNGSGDTFVAYLFAHDAGGFGLTGTDNVISCGSFSSDGTNFSSVNLGYEPQFVLAKMSSGESNWWIFDNMRGIPTGSNDPYLLPNTSGAEATNNNWIDLTSTGFSFNGATVGSGTLIYIAIRRGPMKVPTSGTSVFSPNAVNNATGTQNTTNFPIDLQIFSSRGGANKPVVDRLRGISSNTTESGQYLFTTTTGAEGSDTLTLGWDNNSFKTASGYASVSMIYWNFRRAPSFFDEVCYTGTGSTRTVTHNLAAVPELMIVKNRGSGSSYNWTCYHSALGNGNRIRLNTTAASAADPTAWNSTTPTASVFSIGTDSAVNFSGMTYVAYLFATCAGVSKVGSFTGNGSSQTINCGFTGGARFVMVKATSTTGDWMVADSARGIVSGSDPYLELNNTNAEVTGEDWLDTDSTGFVVNEVSGSNANTNGVSYIFFAVA